MSPTKTPDWIMLSIVLRTWGAAKRRVPIASFVTGDLIRRPACCLSHVAMALRSYNRPSSAVTGLSGSSCVIGQSHSCAIESNMAQSFSFVSRFLGKVDGCWVRLIDFFQIF